MSKYGAGKMYWTEVRIRGSLKNLGPEVVHSKESLALTLPPVPAMIFGIIILMPCQN